MRRARASPSHALVTGGGLDIVHAVVTRRTCDVVQFDSAPSHREVGPPRRSRAESAGLERADSNESVTPANPTLGRRALMATSIVGSNPTVSHLGRWCMAARIAFGFEGRFETVATHLESMPNGSGTALLMRQRAQALTGFDSQTLRRSECYCRARASVRTCHAAPSVRRVVPRDTRTQRCAIVAPTICPA